MHVSFKILPILLLVACTNKPAEKQKEKYAETFPVVKDTMGHQDYALYHNSDGTSPPEYYLYYIGPKTDTIYLNLFATMDLKPSLQFLELFDSNAIHTIDTQPEKPLRKYIINYDQKNSNRYSGKSLFEIRVDTTRKIYNSYPILITNKGTDTAIIGRTINLSLTLEALDSLGKWHNIQIPEKIGCSNCLKYVILPPKECALTLYYNLKGDFKTKLRLRFKNQYSEPFNGSIPYWLFDYVARHSDPLLY